MVESTYRAEIDGLRALAVVPVILFHFGLGCPGGFVGVDVFFVISGYLITGIIQRGIEANNFSLAVFWERRVRRIFPALFVVLVASLAFGFWWLNPIELKRLGRCSIAQTCLLSNVYFWRNISYFEGDGDSKPLLHTWSLAVEEQFYLLFPFLLLLLKKLSKKKLLLVLATITLGSFACSEYYARYNAGAAFYLLPMRAWELLVGCMLAIFPRIFKASYYRDNTIALFGVLTVVIPIVLYDSDTKFPGLNAIPPVLGTAAILFAIAQNPKTWVGNLLSFPPVVFVGVISYSLYLWHWPIFVYTRSFFGQFGWDQAIFALILTIVCATLSWRLIEIPFRKKDTYFKSRFQLSFVALTLNGGIIALSTIFAITNGLPSRFPSYDGIVEEDLTWFGPTPNSQNPESHSFELKNWQENEDSHSDFVLWGDSHAGVLSEMINQLATEHGLTGVAIVNPGTAPLLGYYSAETGKPELEGSFGSKLAAYLRRRKTKNIILVARWSYFTDGMTTYEKHTASRRHLQSYTQERFLTVEENMARLTKGLQDVEAICDECDVRLWVLNQVPEVPSESPPTDLLRWMAEKRKTFPKHNVSLAQHYERQKNALKVFETAFTSKVRLIDPAQYFFDKEDRLICFVQGRSFYRDDDHLTRFGANRLRGLFSEIFREMAEMKYNQN
jgi:peptidoglycan/LPS O-acetylase OafA/YrhL